MNYSGCDLMYYPIMVDLTDKLVTIIGGGKIAFRKYVSLKQYCNNIQIVSSKFNDDFINVKNHPDESVKFIIDEYGDEYIIDSYLVISATDSIDKNNIIARDCKKNHVFCNVVNHAQDGDFIFPSVMRRGELVISVSSSGNSPSLSAEIIKKFEEQFDEDYGEYVSLLGRIRKKILQEKIKPEQKKVILNKLVDMTFEQLKDYNQQNYNI